MVHSKLYEKCFKQWNAFICICFTSVLNGDDKIFPTNSTLGGKDHRSYEWSSLVFWLPENFMQNSNSGHLNIRLPDSWKKSIRSEISTFSSSFFSDRRYLCNWNGIFISVHCSRLLCFTLFSVDRCQTFFFAVASSTTFGFSTNECVVHNGSFC